MLLASKRKEAFYSRVDQEKILKAISDEPELLSIWNEIKDRDELKTMINQVKDLRPSSIKKLLLMGGGSFTSWNIPVYTEQA